MTECKRTDLLTMVSLEKGLLATLFLVFHFNQIRAMFLIQWICLINTQLTTSGLSVL